MTDDLDRCSWSDLPKYSCAHCGAAPGTTFTPDRPWSYDGQRMTRRPVDTTIPTPPDPGPPLRLGTATAGYCACGQPTRNNAYGCDDCAGELHRFYSEVPWLVDQLNTSTARLKAKNPGNSTRGGESLPWLERAAIAQRRITGLLATTVRLCEKAHVAHQSPHSGPPAPSADGGPPSPVEASRWLLWRVDNLPNVALFPNLLRATMHTERHAHQVIDCAPDLLYLGTCTTTQEDRGPCHGAIYAIAGEPTGKCRACRATYPTEPAREALFADLDDRLFTAAELAELSTYLGLPPTATRDRVRKLINQWHTRGRLTSHAHAGQDPLFQYREAAALLAATYNREEAQ